MLAVKVGRVVVLAVKGDKLHCYIFLSDSELLPLRVRGEHHRLALLLAAAGAASLSSRFKAADLLLVTL